MTNASYSKRSMILFALILSCASVAFSQTACCTASPEDCLTCTGSCTSILTTPGCPNKNFTIGPKTLTLKDTSNLDEVTCGTGLVLFSSEKHGTKFNFDGMNSYSWMKCGDVYDITVDGMVFEQTEKVHFFVGNTSTPDTNQQLAYESSHGVLLLRKFGSSNAVAGQPNTLVIKNTVVDMAERTGSSFVHLDDGTDTVHFLTEGEIADRPVEVLFEDCEFKRSLRPLQLSLNRNTRTKVTFRRCSFDGMVVGDGAMFDFAAAKGGVDLTLDSVTVTSAQFRDLGFNMDGVLSKYPGNLIHSGVLDNAFVRLGDGSSLTMKHVTFNTNSVDRMPKGVFVGTGVNVLVDDSSFLMTSRGAQAAPATDLSLFSFTGSSSLTMRRTTIGSQSFAAIHVVRGAGSSPVTADVLLDTVSVTEVASPTYQVRLDGGGGGSAFTLAMTDCELTDGMAGAVHVSGGLTGATISGTTVSDTTDDQAVGGATHAPALLLDSTGAPSAGVISLSNCTFMDNVLSKDIEHDGGAVSIVGRAAADASVTVTECVFAGNGLPAVNEADNQRGVALFADSVATVTIRGISATGNTGGTALHLVAGTSVLVGGRAGAQSYVGSGCVLSANTAGDLPAVLYAKSPLMTVETCAVAGNGRIGPDSLSTEAAVVHLVSPGGPAEGRLTGSRFADTVRVAGINDMGVVRFDAGVSGTLKDVVFTGNVAAIDVNTVPDGTLVFQGTNALNSIVLAARALLTNEGDTTVACLPQQLHADRVAGINFADDSMALDQIKNAAGATLTLVNTVPAGQTCDIAAGDTITCCPALRRIGTMGRVVNNGTLAVESTAGPMTFNAPLVQGSSGVLELRWSDSATDQVHFEEAAPIAPGKVVVQFDFPSGSEPAASTTEQLVTWETGVVPGAEPSVEFAGGAGSPTFAMGVLSVEYTFSCANGCYQHGTCIQANVCQCFPGWDVNNVTCQFASCAAKNDCSGHGSCIEPDTCSCSVGWGSTDTCAVADCNPPGGSCQNGGSCTETPNVCKCLGGFTGADCAIEDTNYVPMTSGGTTFAQGFEPMTMGLNTDDLIIGLKPTIFYGVVGGVGGVFLLIMLLIVACCCRTRTSGDRGGGSSVAMQAESGSARAGGPIGGEYQRAPLKEKPDIVYEELPGGEDLNRKSGILAVEWE